MDTSVLEDIGLTNAEIKVYLALLELGSSTAGPILDRTGMQNSVVHMILNKLIEKGLVSYVREGKRHHYSAADPKHIIDFIDEKRERLEKILPELQKKGSAEKSRPDVTTFRGIKGVRELLYELLDSEGKEHHTMGSPYESVMLGTPFWIDYHKRRARKGIYAKLIFYESLRKWAEDVRKKGHYTKADLRFTKSGFEPLTETIIRGDKVGIILYVQKPIGILLHNRQIAESYEKFFQLHWKQAKE